MFSGIVEEVGVVKARGAESLTISANRVLEEAALGDSIAVNGVCLTVTAMDKGSFSADVMTETLRCTNLGLLRIGGRVNLERAVKLGGRLGGHFVQGHVDAVGKVSSLVSERNAVLLKCSAPAQVMRYIVKKGFIAIDGVSLTVVERDISSFKVSLVTYSRANTTLGERRLADSVNLEVDILAKYVEILVKGGGTGVTTDLLTKYGFLA